MLTLSLQRQKSPQSISAIGKWKPKDITSAAFISKYNLSSASSVQSAVKALITKKLVSCSAKIYTVSDKYLALWLRMQ